MNSESPGVLQGFQSSDSHGTSPDDRESSLTVPGSRLANLRIHFWTQVPITDVLAAELLSSYFRVEHPVYGFFDEHLFIKDLLSQDVQFCSPLLVNAILFWACVSPSGSDIRKSRKLLT